MPEAKKISELPVLSSVQPNDIIPIVDSGLAATHRCTASQIAAVGGGPPGANTVNNTHLQEGAVTASKTQFTSPDKLFSRTAGGAGSGVEIVCTGYARGLLAAANGSDARAYLDALQSTNSPIFTGQVQVAKGSVAVPSIVPSTALDTGLFFPEEGVLSVASTNIELFRMGNDGLLLSPISGVAGLRPNAGARAWVKFNGSAAAGTSYSIVANQLAVARRYGRTTHVIGHTQETEDYMAAEETARGLTLVLPTAPTFNDFYGKGTFPAYNRGTETRANYTTPGDNHHWIRVGGQWQLRSATLGQWIGTLTVTTPPSASPVREAIGISGITRISPGIYTVLFEDPMPDNDYCVVATASIRDTFVTNQTNNSFRVSCLNSSNSAADPSTVFCAVFR